jgi:hypothetical protein
MVEWWKYSLRLKLTVFEVYSQAQALIPWAPKQKVDGVGLWAKHFAPMNSQNSSKIPVE